MKILLIEDEARVVSFINQGMTEEGYQMTIAMDGAMGWELFQKHDFDLVILDIMLPKMNGIEICKKIRETDTMIPILFLTALGTSENVVLGLNSGADDYIVKPFKFIELIARVKSLLRRADKTNAIPVHEDEIYELEDLRLNNTTKVVEKSGNKVSLTSTEFRLLLYFFQNTNKVLSRMQILENVWDVNFKLSTNVVDVYVNYLRKKVDNGHKKLIHTVIGMGYTLRIND